jgi:hypothetical protein
MGTITRSFANNITTSGVLLPASLTNNSIANVTAYNAAIVTGNMVLLSTQTASNSASVSFTSGINSTYKEYQFWFIDYHSRTAAPYLEVNFSTDGGSNYNVTKTSTFFRYIHKEDDAATGLDYITSQDSAQSTSNALISEGVASNADSSLGGYLQLFNPASTVYVKHFISTNNCDASTYQMGALVAGYCNTTSAINAVRFSPTSGNFDGTILMYGIV